MESYLRSLEIEFVSFSFLSCNQSIGSPSGKQMTTHSFYMLHSAYPDGSWRGIEKCLGRTCEEDSAPMLFETRERAETYRELNNPEQKWRAVLVQINVPNIREPLNE